MLKNNQLEEEKRNRTAMLERLLPPKVVRSLLDHGKYEPESYSQCGLFFSDIENFTVMCMNLNPRQVFDLLDQVYRVMDECTAKHKLYKVETMLVFRYLY